MAYPITFVGNHQASVVYLNKLRKETPTAGFVEKRLDDREHTICGKIAKLTPVSVPNSNRHVTNFFNKILTHKYINESVHVYSTYLFDRLYHNQFGVPELRKKENFVEDHNILFNGVDDYNVVQKDVLVVPINYAFAWHLVVIDKPMNAARKNEEVQIYFVSAHQVTPEHSMSKFVARYIEMAFAVLGLKTYPENFKYQELVLESCASQSQVLCAVYTELVFKIAEHKMGMEVFFSGFKPQAQDKKFEHKIFLRCMESLLECIAVENNPHGQLPGFELALIEDEDLSWIEPANYDKVLTDEYQDGLIRPVRQFMEPLEHPEPMKDWFAKQVAKRCAGDSTKIVYYGESDSSHSGWTGASFVGDYSDADEGANTSSI
ncbi:hypothetical protein L5515_017388 [Caenorhabditis briggsae]|uniref:Ubiquitin-like protease family profile domain-containing protein n=1 Tax=Caenorhabditis briggsae TaxID=6238 RepID=A0AAE9FEE5_CAEBR|nr:hypothetical protein L5515_017388 [Caenorhabditis briggsae]